MSLIRTLLIRVSGPDQLGVSAELFEVLSAIGAVVKDIEQIVVPLKNAGLVTSTRGLRGGFRLSKLARDISLYDILRATEGDFKKVEMLIEGKSRSDSIIMEEVWQGAFQELLNYFSNVSLQECLEKYVKHMDKEPIMFNI